MKNLKIGIDWGGVITFAVEPYGEVLKSLKNKGHEIIIASHAIHEQDALSRQEFCDKYGFQNATFVMPANQEDQIRIRKAELVKDMGIDLFIDDSRERCAVVADHNHNCTCIYAPQGNWDLTFEILKAIS